MCFISSAPTANLTYGQDFITCKKGTERPEHKFMTKNPAHVTGKDAVTGDKKNTKGTGHGKKSFSAENIAEEAKKTKSKIDWRLLAERMSMFCFDFDKDISPRILQLIVYFEGPC